MLRAQYTNAYVSAAFLLNTRTMIQVLLEIQCVSLSRMKSSAPWHAWVDLQPSSEAATERTTLHAYSRSRDSLLRQKAIRRYPIRKVTTPVPVEGAVEGGALPSG